VVFVLKVCAIVVGHKKYKSIKRKRYKKIKSLNKSIQAVFAGSFFCAVYVGLKNVNNCMKADLKARPFLMELSLMELLFQGRLLVRLNPLKAIEEENMWRYF